MRTVFFCGEECNVIFGQYQDSGRVAITLECQNGEPMAVATVNIPEAHLEKDEVLIKDYSENQGMLDVLTKVGIVKATGRQINSGFVSIPICKLL